MTISRKQLESCIVSLPDFHQHPYDVVKIPGLSITVAKLTTEIMPNMSIPFTVTFVKNYELEDWVLRQINYGAETVYL